MKTKKKKTPSSEIDKLTHEFKKANSFWRSFIKGIFVGVGTAIGAALIAGLVIVMLTKLISSMEEIPLLKNLIESSNIQSILEKTQ
jgi:hypothetical protein